MPLSAVRLAALASVSLLALPATAQVASGVAQPSVRIQPLYGAIKPFYGNISPFYGAIQPFYGNLKPFYGNLKPFWGDVGPLYGAIQPFWGANNPFVANTSAAVVASYGAGVDPFWGGGNANPYLHNPSPFVNYAQIAGFWSAEAQAWGKVQSAWATASTDADYASLATLLQTTIVNPAAGFWGNAIAHASKAQQAQGQSIVTALSASGIGLNADGTINGASLAGVSPTAQAMLFLDMYDGLMSYSGAGRVDWWMGATHWSPLLAAAEATPIQGATPVTVGMLDFTVSNSVKNAKGSLLQYGSTVFSNGHGAAVGSLIMGALDGSGVMGVLPAGAANVVVYDPYDASGTTNWTDVATGVQVLANSTFSKKGAPTGVLNASLGVPGWTLNPGWNTALSSGAAHGHNLVIAAGNDGVTQTANVPWNFALNPNILIVGSVGLDGTISNFSNRPGEACLLDTASASSLCSEANKLKYRFIVAPGELVLVSDGSGGVVRQSGTSLAAPLVSAAIGMLQARWPWLANHPDETAQIILKTATPLGTQPGADATYGAGELNIEASQSPLSWKALRFYPVVNGKPSASPVGAAGIVSLVAGGAPATWNASKLSITAFETIGDTYRDFQIPLANTLVGQSASRGSGTGLFQSYLATGLKAWVATGGNFVGSNASDAALLGFAQASAPVARLGGMDLVMRVAPRHATSGFTQGNLESDTDFALLGQHSSLRFGVGQGAAAVGGQDGFTDGSDFDIRRGGADPLLGLASGGAFVDWRFGATDRVSINLGATQRRDERDPALFGIMDPSSPARVYDAAAQHLGVDLAMSRHLTVHAGVTQLREADGILGVQSLASGATMSSASTSSSLGFSWEIGNGLSLAATATMAKTKSSADQSLSTGSGGLRSTAGEISLSKVGVFSRDDRLRIDVAQSSHVYGGELHYTSYGVIDRQTGALGLINQSSQAGGGAVPWSAEVMYGRVSPSSGSEISTFLRAELNGQAPGGADTGSYVVGGKYRLVF